MPDYPPGYDPIQADPNGGSFISPADQSIGALIALGAFGIEVGIFALAGALGGFIPAYVDVALTPATGFFDVEVIIAEDVLASGGSMAQAARIISQMATQRSLLQFIAEAAAADAAAAETALVIAAANAGVAAVTATIIQAQANMQEQASLHIFFTSGL